MSDKTERDLERQASSGNQAAATKLIQLTLKTKGDPLMVLLEHQVRLQRCLFAMIKGQNPVGAFKREVEPTAMLAIVRDTVLLPEPPKEKEPAPSLSQTIYGDCRGNPALKDLLLALSAVPSSGISDQTALGKPLQGEQGTPGMQGPPGEPLRIKDQNGTYQKVSNLELPTGSSLWGGSHVSHADAAPGSDGQVWQLDLVQAELKQVPCEHPDCKQEGQTRCGANWPHQSQGCCGRTFCRLHIHSASINSVYESNVCKACREDEDERISL